MYCIHVALDTLQKSVRELNRSALRFSYADLVATCTHKTRLKDLFFFDVKQEGRTPTGNIEKKGTVQENNTVA